jgi:hypothetical protein
MLVYDDTVNIIVVNVSVVNIEWNISSFVWIMIAS